VLSDSEIDQLLLSFCEHRWLKVARIVGKALDELEQRGILSDSALADMIDLRVELLVSKGCLEAQGNIKNWGSSEVRLPGI
jgi:hypothetical protein